MLPRFLQMNGRLFSIILAACVACLYGLDENQIAEIEGCPGGWKSLGDKCMKLFRQGATFADAEAQCARFSGGHLVSIHSDAEWSTFFRYVFDITRSRVWIGLHLVGNGRSWKNTDGSSTSYMKFNKPINVILRMSGECFTRDSYYMTPYPCQNTLPYACQVPKADGCGQPTSVVGLAGAITSPNYPKPYTDNAFCRWSFEAPENHTMTVTLNDFESELHFDRLKIYTESSAVAVFQGSYITPVLFPVNDDKLYLVWKTDAKDNKFKGFSVSYKASDCNKLEPIANGNVTVSGITAGDSAIYTCNEGYELTSTGVLNCTSAGWSNPSPSCQRVQCPNLTNPVNGRLKDRGIGFVFEGKVVIECDIGFETRAGERTVERACQANMTWTGSDTSCQRVDCGHLPNTVPGHLGKVHVTSTLFNSSVTATCAYGVRKGNTSRICLADGSWSGNDLYCNEAVSCDFKYHMCAWEKEQGQDNLPWNYVEGGVTPTAGKCDEWSSIFVPTYNTKMSATTMRIFRASVNVAVCQELCVNALKHNNFFCKAHWYYLSYCYLSKQHPGEDPSLLKTERFRNLYTRQCKGPGLMKTLQGRDGRVARVKSGAFVSVCPQILTFQYYFYGDRNLKASLKVIQEVVSPFIGKSSHKTVLELTGPTFTAFSEDNWQNATVVLPVFPQSNFTPQKVVVEVAGKMSETSVRNVEMKPDCPASG